MFQYWIFRAIYVKAKYILFTLLLSVVFSAKADSQQTVILNSPPNFNPPTCGYTYNGNEEYGSNQATFSQNENYTTETYSTKPKNPYPYYGNACGNANSIWGQGPWGVNNR
jgi:hypothetical protein